MKKLLVVSFCLIFSFSAFTQDDLKPEKEAIKKVIQTAYVDGLQNKGDIALTEKGFNPGFNLLILRNNMLEKLPIYNWIEYAKMKKQKNPEPPAENEIVTCEYLFIDITGNAAVAKIALYKDSKQIYTDYLSLYKFDDGWKIVSKIYHKES